MNFLGFHVLVGIKKMSDFLPSDSDPPPGKLSSWPVLSDMSLLPYWDLAPASVLADLSGDSFPVGVVGMMFAAPFRFLLPDDTNHCQRPFLLKGWTQRKTKGSPNPEEKNLPTLLLPRPTLSLWGQIGDKICWLSCRK